jgi:hypothetical protein
LCLLWFLIFQSIATAQNESILREYFEGKTVTVRIDMPGSSQGVDVRPTSNIPLDFPAAADRIKRYGIGIHNGESIMITKLVLKKDHIEVQLGGGGFGTFKDTMILSSNNPTAFYEGKSNRERDLEDQLKYENRGWRRDQIRSELDRLRRDRERNNTYIAVQNNQVEQQKKQEERELRASSGSRFNIWYKDGFPQGANTPQGVISALEKYVDFQGPSQSFSSNPSYSVPLDGPLPPSNNGLGALRKGMTVAQAERILGPAAKVTQQNEGSIEIVSREYNTDDGLKVRTKFASGVLIDFSAGPNK